MELIYTDASHSWRGVLKDFELDMAYGDDENDFELTVDKSMKLAPGSLIFEYGTGRGGVIDRTRYNGKGDAPTLSYTGRTWHGIMSKSITRPNNGQSWIVLNGDMNAVIGELIERQGLGGVMAPSGAPSGVILQNYQLPRFISLWEALRRLTRDKGMRVNIERRDGKTVVSAVPMDVYDSGTVSDRSTSMDAERIHRTTNHLILLGKGELSDRLVLDVYADENGSMTTEQYFFGVDEIADVYEQASEEDASKLLNGGAKKLLDMQIRERVSMDVSEGATYNIGDVVRAYATEVGLSAEAEIVKAVCNVDSRGQFTESYTLSEPRIHEYD